MSGSSTGWAGSFASASMTTALGRRAARRRPDHVEPAVPRAQRPLRLSRARLHAGDAARERLGRGRRPPSQDRVLASPPLRLSERARRPIRPLARHRLQPPRPRHRPVPGRRAACARARGPAAAPPTNFDFAGARPVRVGLDGYLKPGGNFYRAPLALVHQRVELRFNRDHVWIRHSAETVARYPRSYEQGCWFPPPQLRPEPPAPAPVARLVVASIAPPGLADYAELCA